MIFMLLFLSAFSYIQGHPVLKIYGDVHRDQRFFDEILPLLMDNIGGFVVLEFNLLGSGVYSVPEMCALSQLGANNFLQAQYLQCEASGMSPPEACLCLVDIEPKAYRSCVYTKGWLARDAYNKYTSKYSNIETPIVETNQWTITGTESTFDDYLTKICSLLGAKPPITCSEPIHDSTGRRGAVSFDCSKMDPMDMGLSHAIYAKPKNYNMTKSIKGDKKKDHPNQEIHLIHVQKTIPEEKVVE